MDDANRRTKALPRAEEDLWASPATKVVLSLVSLVVLSVRLAQGRYGRT